MDQALRRTAMVALGAIVLLMANVTWIMGFQAQSLRDDPRNSRRFTQQYQQDRGSILAGDLKIAYSVKTGRNTYQRRYREGAAFSPITGYFAAYRKSGLEQAEDSLLGGTDERLSVRNTLNWLTGERPRGADVHTTIDPRAQLVAYRLLQRSTGLRAAAVAIDSRTGAIKVMASYPSYDPNEVANHDTAAAASAFARLESAEGKPLLNKAARELFPPGSSFKIVTAAAVLGQGIAEDGPVPAGSSYRLPGTTTVIGNSHDSGSCGLPSTTLIDAFAQSCNTTFAALGAEALGSARMRARAVAFGYGTRFELAPGLRSVASFFPAADPAQTALASYGQGANAATVLQMALVASGALNAGVVMRPYLVEEITSGRATIEQAEPREFGRAIGGAEAQALRDMMNAVVERGTATNLQGQGVAGKTGTADVDGQSYNDRWFVGYGTDGPYAVAVMTEGTGYGATAAGPIAAEIARALR